MNNNNHHTYIASHTGKIIYFIFQHEDEETEIAYPAIFVSETMWNNQDITDQQTVIPEKTGIYYLTVAANFTISHKEQKENYHYEKKMKIIVE